MQFPYDHPREPSAFSEYNTMTGPFFDGSHRTDRLPSKAATRAKEGKDNYGDGFSTLR